MSKTIRNVFIVIGVLLLCLIVWFFVFDNGLQVCYNGVRTVVNGAWQTVVGGDAELLPEWTDDYNTGNLGDAEDDVGGL